MTIDLELLHKGKVRDIYNIDDEKILIIASDRVSAFDIIFKEKVVGKGKILTNIANFWFSKTQHIIPNHILPLQLENFLPQQQAYNLKQRAVIVKKLKPIRIEAVVRSYITGSAWLDYKKNGKIGTIAMPENMQLAQKLYEPLYTPALKISNGGHDINIDFDKTVKLVGKKIASQIKNISLALYNFASDYALSRDIIIADTKFEFGLDNNNNLILIDELLTPDSSRFWDKNNYQIGSNPPSFDKQFLRDYLDNSKWDKKSPPPQIPETILKQMLFKYQEIATRLMS